MMALLLKFEGEPGLVKISTLAGERGMRIGLDHRMSDPVAKAVEEIFGKGELAPDGIASHRSR